MTYEQAYAEGFCKAAEAIGVNPVLLYKQAAGGSKILGFLAGAGRGKGTSLKRFMELLRGGNKALKSEIAGGSAGATMGQFPGQAGRNLLERLGFRLRVLKGTNPAGEFSPAATREARRALATQLRTGLAAGGILGGGAGIAAGVNALTNKD